MLKPGTRGAAGADLAPCAAPMSPPPAFVPRLKHTGSGDTTKRNPSRQQRWNSMTLSPVQDPARPTPAAAVLDPRSQGRRSVCDGRAVQTLSGAIRPPG